MRRLSNVRIVPKIIPKVKIQQICLKNFSYYKFIVKIASDYKNLSKEVY